MFKACYDKALIWSRHRHAAKYLSCLSFAESSFFPVPPDVMLAPMALARPDRAFYFAFLTTLFSVLGGMSGFGIGYFMFDAIAPWLQESRYASSYHTAENAFQEWGVWVVFVAGFSPIPYKVFTIAAGALQMAFLPFILASLVGRGLRFFLVATLLKAGGSRLENQLRQYMDILGWLVVGLVVAAVIYKLYF